MQNYSSQLSTLITEARLAKNLSQKELASMTGLTPALISKYESGKSKPRAETLQKIAKALSIPPSSLIESAAIESSTYNVPYLSNTDLSYLDQPFYNIDSAELKKINVQPSGLCAMKVISDSMSPTLNQYDSILIDRTQQQVLDGSIFLVEYGGLIIIKRLYSMPFGAVRLASDNSAYPDYQLSKDEKDSDQFNIIGKVVWRSGAI